MGEAEEHLSRVCKRFARVVPGHEPYPTEFEKTKDPYRVLVRAVVYQQLSGKAAGTIHVAGSVRRRSTLCSSASAARFPAT